MMVDVLKRAIRELRTHTASPSRKVARWLEDHPGRAFLEPNERPRARSSFFSGHDLSLFFGLSGGEWRQPMGQGA